jgi:hypothetical protein
VTRCSHGNLARYCPIRSCSHWDGALVSKDLTRARPKPVVIELPGQFTCRRCNKSQPVSEYHAERSSSRGHQSRCKACHRLRDQSRAGLT